MKLETKVDYYYGTPNELGNHNMFLVFTSEQKKHIAYKIASLYNKREVMMPHSREELFRYVEATMVRGSDVTYNHFSKMVAMSKVGKHRNPILLTLGYEGSRAGNERGRVNEYRHYIESAIVSNDYAWSYTEMMKEARAFSKGIPVDEIKLADIPTSDNFIRELEKVKAKIDECVPWAEYRSCMKLVAKLVEIVNEQDSMIEELQNNQKQTSDDDIAARIKGRLEVVK